MSDHSPLPTLPFHLTLSLSAWISSTIASGCLKSALPLWKQLGGKEQDLAALESLPQAVNEEAQARLNGLLQGVSLYQSLGYQRSITEPPTIWRQGAARLLDYGVWEEPRGRKKPAPMVLFVPSLINRYYILDLEQKRSFARFALEQGVHPLILDWGEPGAQEAAYDTGAYIAGPLKDALEFLHATSGEQVTLAGYCMGGVLALGAAQLYPKRVKALALFATPWDFHAPDISAPKLDGAMLEHVNAWLGAYEVLPHEIIQTLFYLNDPWLFQDKFRRFASLTPGTAPFREFVALEHWVNDGVGLAREVARDCIIRWGQENQLADFRWRIGSDALLDPRRLKLPTFIAAPKQDHIVPPGCALPLHRLIKGSVLHEPTSGHVGMMVGSRARRELWEPFVEWLTEVG